MKNHLLTILLGFLCIFTISPAIAQNLRAGARLGLNISSLSNQGTKGEGDFKNLSDLGFQIGAVGILDFTDLLAFQAELLFTQKGGKFKQTMTSDDGSSTLLFKDGTNISYIELPLLARANHKMGDFTLFGNLGPYLGFAISGRDHLYSPIESKAKIPIKAGGINWFDLGLAFGAGVGYEIGPGELLLDLRYELGFLDTNRPGEKPDGYKGQCNRTFSVSLVYLIDLD